MPREGLRSRKKKAEIVPETPPPVTSDDQLPSPTNNLSSADASTSTSQQPPSSSIGQGVATFADRRHDTHSQHSSLFSDPYEVLSDRENPLEFLEKIGDYREVVTSTPKSTLNGNLRPSSPISPFLQELSNSIETPTGFEKTSFNRRVQAISLEQPTDSSTRLTSFPTMGKGKGKEKEITTTKVLRLRPQPVARLPSQEPAPEPSNQPIEVIEHLDKESNGKLSTEIFNNAIEGDPFGFAEVEQIVRTRRHQTPPPRQPLTPVKPVSLDNLRNIRDSSPAFRIHTPKASDISEDSEKENTEPCIVIDRPPSKRPLSSLKYALRSNRKKETAVKDFTALLPKRRGKKSLDGQENAPKTRQRKPRKTGNTVQDKNVPARRSRVAEKGKYVPGRRRMPQHEESSGSETDDSIKRLGGRASDLSAHGLARASTPCAFPSQASSHRPLQYLKNRVK
ncbi:hypothetical protein K493DRAFT_340674 [Basidiobolus meristosporus CBS 931.73]|uniref:Uncharacterized protein n=1 Tax=Basidiobolus meristosporus CBS 931.73 TaxID=1314790 RepID=A0A1Y1XV77_9FUNG|nr:hypothetical protein K493DRAFT_340674 [Basidiobolus meristosporus CBS 931.73]|eukprot:ORX89396.1 hypothetical protein K493DRAFT_340674 [Basidiobolus meristosporus CBS 931.73]